MLFEKHILGKGSEKDVKTIVILIFLHFLLCIFIIRSDIDLNDLEGCSISKDTSLYLFKHLFVEK